MSHRKLRTAVVCGLAVLGALLTSGAAAQAQSVADSYVCQFNGLTGVITPDELNLNPATTEGTAAGATGNAGVEGPPTEALEQIVVPPNDNEAGLDEASANDAADGDDTASNNAIDNLPTGDDDGGYTFGGSGTCTFVDGDPTGGLGDPGGAGGSGAYCAAITSNGNYENIVAGTGNANSDSDAADTGGTTVTFGPANPAGPCNANAGQTAKAEGPASAATYEITFAGGSGTLVVNSINNGEGEAGTGGGYVNIVPSTIAANGDVQVFTVNGGFTVAVPDGA